MILLLFNITILVTFTFFNKKIEIQSHPEYFRASANPSYIFKTGKELKSSFIGSVCCELNKGISFAASLRTKINQQ